MKTKCALFVTLMGVTVLAGAQSPAPQLKDTSMITLETPLVLGKDRGMASLDLRGFEGSDKLFRTGVGFRYGLGSGLEAQLGADFASVHGFGFGDGNAIRFGGSDGEMLLKYRIPVCVDASIQAGFSYGDTPAQNGTTSTLVGLSVGYEPVKTIRVYANPKITILDKNSLIGIGLGAVADLAPHLSLIGEWTPIVSGNNSLSTSDGGRDKVQIYGIALRYLFPSPSVSFDLGYTNSTGQTTGFGLTPGLGDSGAIYVRASYRF